MRWGSDCGQNWTAEICLRFRVVGVRSGGEAQVSENGDVEGREEGTNEREEKVRKKKKNVRVWIVW